MPQIITLLTDFGTQDGYVGAMKGVLCREAPGATIVDVTHDIPPQDVPAGAFALAAAAPWFPSGTIHVAVVDPGVGSARRALLVEHGGQRFIGPDNGLLSLAAPSRGRVIDRIPRDWSISATFHGRDLFARVAGRIAAGAPIEELAGEEVDPLRLAMPPVEEAGEAGSGRVGAVIHIDRFGNLITNFTDDDIAGSIIEIAGTEVPAGRTYTDVERGRLVAYRGSAGYIEVAVRDGSAAALLGVPRGARVRWRPR